MGGYGTVDIHQGGRGLSPLVHRKGVAFKIGAMTIDWSTITAVVSDTTLPDGTVVKAGHKYIRYGTIMSQITASGKYGPADTSETDGRQTVDATQRGKSFILDQTIIESEPGSEIVGSAIEEGLLYKDRLVIDGTNQPTEANLLAMFPGARIQR